MARTKKVKSAGRFKARYGIKARRTVMEIEEKERAAYPCPSCGAQRLYRSSAGIWECAKCETRFAGGAYQPRTEAGLGVVKEGE